MLGAAGITLALICEAALNSQNQQGTKTGLSIGGVFFVRAYENKVIGDVY